MSYEEEIDLTTVDAEGSVLEGDFASTIEEAEFKQTRNGQGTYLRLKLALDSGTAVWDNLNIVNPNPTAERIARARLKTILGLVGLDQNKFRDAATLIDKRVTVRVKKDVREDGSEQPRIAKYISIDAPKGLASHKPADNINF